MTNRKNETPLGEGDEAAAKIVQPEFEVQQPCVVPKNGKDTPRSKPCLSWIIVHPGSKHVAFFVAIITVFSVFSTTFAAYFACFGEPVTDPIIIFELVMEICFALDIVRIFLTQYVDPQDPKRYINDPLKIAKHYITSSFVFDVLSLSAWPLRNVVRGSWEPEHVSLIYLLRLFRLSKILVIMDLDKFIGVVRSYYRRNLIKVVQPDRVAGKRGKVRIFNSDDHTVDNNRILPQIFLIKGFQVFRLIVFIGLLAYFMGTLWFLVTKLTTHSEEDFTFYNVYGLADLTDG